MKMVNRWKKEEIMSAAKEKKPTAELMGGDKNVKIFCNEHLTPKKQRVLNEAKKLKDKYYVWSKKGAVMCKSRIEGGKPFQLLDIEDVGYLLETATSNGELNQMVRSNHIKRPLDEISPSYSAVNISWRQRTKRIMVGSNNREGTKGSNGQANNEGKK